MKGEKLKIMKNNGLKNAKAITLIAMVVTIIVLLILAGVSIAVLTGENGILNRATSAKQTHEEKTEEEKLKLGVLALSTEYRSQTTHTYPKFSGFVNSKIADLAEELGVATSAIVVNTTNDTLQYREKTYTLDSLGGITDYVESPNKTWTQTGTSVTDGDVTLNVGSEVSGYTATVNSTEIGNGKWFVLGAEDGKLLITTNKSYETVQLSGIEDYLGGGLTKLNNAAAKYLDNGGLGSSARTLKYEDINRVTGFNPATDGSNVGAVYEYGNEVTYTKGNDGCIHYIGSKQPTTDTTSSYDTKFEYWNGTELVELGTGESTTLTCTYASYNGSSLDSTIKGLFFTNSGNHPGDTGIYWLGSPSVYCFEGYANFGLHFVFSSNVNNFILFNSNGGTGSPTGGLRPVVSLASDVKVTINNNVCEISK